MAATVDLDSARTALQKAWAEIDKPPRPPGRMRQLIEGVLRASPVTFKYILVTGYLAKWTNPRVHARALQVGSDLPGAYDARNLCHHVVVGFEKSKGNLFGLSNEPFVNKPARHHEHDGDNPQLRDKRLAKLLHEALEIAQSGSRDEVFQGLVHILRIGKMKAADEKQAIANAQVTLSKVLDFIEVFLQETNGGARLVGVWGALVALLSENGEIKVYSPNLPDHFGKTAGDVEVYYAGQLVAASECKQRPMNLDDVNHGIKKALDRGVPEYRFVHSTSLARGQKDRIADAIKKHSKELDLDLVDIRSQAPLLVAMLNPVRRAKFGATVVELLRRMRKFESANAAAELWNRIKG